MRKRIIGASVAILAVLGIICWVKYSSYKPTSYQIDGDGYSATVINGGELIFDVYTDAATDFTWVIAEEPTTFASDYSSCYTIDTEENAAGANSVTEFHIIALDDGSGTMVLRCQQNSDSGDMEKTYLLSLDISRHYKKYLQIDAISFCRADGWKASY